MSSPVATKQVVLDASFVIAYCSKEPDTYTKADAKLSTDYASGVTFFAPGALIQECLYVFCKKAFNGQLNPADHAIAVDNLIVFLQAIKPPPSGDFSLTGRSEQIRKSYACSRTADSIYLALTEQLAATGPAEIVTFDAQLENQAKKNAPSVNVVYLGD